MLTNHLDKIFGSCSKFIITVCMPFGVCRRNIKRSHINTLNNNGPRIYPEVHQIASDISRGYILRYLNKLESGCRFLVCYEIQKYVGLKVDTLNAF